MDQLAVPDTVVTFDAVVAFLSSTALFDRLDASERAEVARIMEVQRLTDGEEVFREGEQGDAWYIVYEGRARVLKRADDGSREIAALEARTCFGEMAILDNEVRSATVRADGPMTVLRFRRSIFEQLLEQSSLGAYKLVLEIARVLSRRHRRLTEQLIQNRAVDRSATQASEYQISE